MTLYELLQTWRAPDRSMVSKSTRNIMVYQVDDQGKEEYLLSFSYQDLGILTHYLYSELLGCKVERFSMSGNIWTMEVVVHEQ